MGEMRQRRALLQVSRGNEAGLKPCDLGQATAERLVQIFTLHGDLRDLHKGVKERITERRIRAI